MIEIGPNLMQAIIAIVGFACMTALFGLVLYFIFKGGK